MCPNQDMPPTHFNVHYIAMSHPYIGVNRLYPKESNILLPVHITTHNTHYHQGIISILHLDIK